MIELNVRQNLRLYYLKVMYKHHLFKMYSSCELLLTLKVPISSPKLLIITKLILNFAVKQKTINNYYTCAS